MFSLVSPLPVGFAHGFGGRISLEDNVAGRLKPLDVEGHTSSGRFDCARERHFKSTLEQAVLASSQPAREFAVLYVPPAWTNFECRRAIRDASRAAQRRLPNSRR
jgi:hypothetical protein